MAGEFGIVLLDQLPDLLTQWRKIAIELCGFLVYHERINYGFFHAHILPRLTEDVSSDSLPRSQPAEGQQAVPNPQRIEKKVDRVLGPSHSRIKVMTLGRSRVRMI